MHLYGATVTSLTGRSTEAGAYRGRGATRDNRRSSDSRFSQIHQRIWGGVFHPSRPLMQASCQILDDNNEDTPPGIRKIENATYPRVAEMKSKAIDCSTTELHLHDLAVHAWT